MNAIRSYEEFQRSLRCFDWIEDTPVSGASDIDLLIERNGRFLVLEAKHRVGPSFTVPLGQWIALQRLSGVQGFEVWLVAEDDEAKEDNRTPHYSIIKVQPDLKPHFRNNFMPAHVGFYTDRAFVNTTLAGLKDMVQDWWKGI